VISGTLNYFYFSVDGEEYICYFLSGLKASWKEWFLRGVYGVRERDSGVGICCGSIWDFFAGNFLETVWEYFFCVEKILEKNSVEVR